MLTSLYAESQRRETDVGFYVREAVYCDRYLCGYGAHSGAYI
jgi:hypothetical protein